jgi:hypothetical protein
MLGIQSAILNGLTLLVTRESASTPELKKHYDENVVGWQTLSNDILRGVADSLRSSTGDSSDPVQQLRR